ncbi:MAG: ATP-binding protein [Blautia sp.]|nr:ATP-binding protein [Blautia sp.]MCM1199878.1 ATP-binding protein [Bacteroides fragilis]
MFLNNHVSCKAYKAVVEDMYFVDKSELIEELFPLLGRKNRYVCITRPRRFGKTVMANMVGAFFEKTESAKLFDGLAVARNKAYRQYLNKYDVIYIDFSRAPELCTSYHAYITRIIDGLKKDIWNAFPDLAADNTRSIWDILQEVNEKTNTTFIFVMDEWDAVFHMHFITEKDWKEYLLFLKYLLKDQPYVELAYMTGVLPITKYSSGSELNMFAEYNMVEAEKFSVYFGFRDVEVDKLYQIYKETTKTPGFSRDDLRVWYDGYYTAVGERLYNPRSIVLALTDNQLRNYWTSSGPYDEIFYYIQNNVNAIKDDLALMAAGERVSADIGQYAAGSMEIDSREQIYSAMVVYGLLTYADGEVFIPNKELMDQFNEMLLSKDSLGYVYQLAKKSEQMFQATLAGDTKTMEEILQFAHDTESPILSYNNEAELSAVVNLCYLSARNRYRVEREEKAGKGFVDFIFYPERPKNDCLILELKVDGTPEEAIAQIKNKKYALRFQGQIGEKEKYTGRILAVGISYHRKSKKHRCRIEILDTSK